MSFRTEDKFNINFEDISKLKKFFEKNKAKKIFPDRNIISLYLDTENFDMFHDSEEGLLPRKKIRLREYDKKKIEIDSTKKILFEKKITSVEGKFKISKKIFFSKKRILSGFFDNDYGLCYPCVYTKYKRSYIKYKNSRITIDSDIKYASYDDLSCKFRSYNTNVIMEIKSNEKNYNDLLNNIPLNKIRYSKFCEAVKHLKDYMM